MRKVSRKQAIYKARAVMLRRWQILRGNALVTGLMLFSYISEALMMGSVFLKSPAATSGYFARGGVIFLYVLHLYPLRPLVPCYLQP